MTDVSAALSKLVGSFDSVANVAKEEVEKQLAEAERQDRMTLSQTETISPPLAMEAK